MAGLRIDEATRAALAAGDLRAATRALMQVNPQLQLGDLPAALKAVRQAVAGGGARGAAAGTERTAETAAAAVRARVAPKRVPTVAPGDGGSLAAMRLLAMVAVAALFAAAWWFARGG